MGRLLVILLLGSGLALSATKAVAQTFNERQAPLSFRDPVDPADDPLYGGRGELSLSASLYFSSTSERRVSSISPVLAAHHDFTRDGWGGHLQMPLSYLDTATTMDPGTTLMRFANLTLGVHKRFSHEATTGTVALDIALPTARVPTDAPDTEIDATRVAYATSNATRGSRAPWLFAAERLSIVARGAVSHRLVEAVDLFAEGGVAPLIPAGPEASEVELFVEAAVGAAWVVPDLVRLGLQLQLAWLPVGVGDPVQTSLELFGRLNFERLFVAAGFTMNLDAPAGFAFDTGGVWGLHLGVGIRF